jgi:peroxiredoxin
MATLGTDMNRRLMLSSTLCTGLCAAWTRAEAALEVGDRAPDFSAQAALGGKVFRYSLAEALARGPVVLYFFPAAFSEGCSLEAHEFAEASNQFAEAGASIAGVSADDIETLTQFSVKACQSRFAVVSDESHGVIKAFDTAMQTRPDYANRVSYVIAPGGTIAQVYASLNPMRHVDRTLAAVREIAAAPLRR